MAIIDDDEARASPPEPSAVADADAFGFVAYPVGCAFEGGTIVAVPNHNESVEWMREQSFRPNVLPMDNARDWRWERRILFPPLVTSREWTADGMVELPNTTRPATTFSVPATHAIRLECPAAKLSDLREKDSGFLIRAFALLFDSPAQFHDWWFDAPLSIGAASLDPTEKVASAFLTTAYRTWLDWPPSLQQQMLSALYLFARAPGHQWYWEHFAWEYTVADALYAIAAELDPKLPARGAHNRRLRRMIESFELAFGSDESEWLNTIVCLRNELIHQARWAGHQPSTSTSQRAVHAPWVLHDLNQRLIVTLLGYRNDFVRTSWSTGFNYAFEEK